MLADLLEATVPASDAAATRSDDVCFWLYTSGSTGKPKGAVHVHANPRLTADLYAGGVLGLTARAALRRPLAAAVQWLLVVAATLAIVGCWRLALSGPGS